MKKFLVLAIAAAVTAASIGCGGTATSTTVPVTKAGTVTTKS